MFYSKYKRKDPSYIFEVVNVLCVESLMRSRGIYLYTHLELSRSRLCQELGDHNLKPLSKVSKSQVRVLVVVVDQGKK